MKISNHNPIRFFKDGLKNYTTKRPSDRDYYKMFNNMKYSEFPLNSTIQIQIAADLEETVTLYKIVNDVETEITGTTKSYDDLKFITYSITFTDLECLSFKAVGETTEESEIISIVDKDLIKIEAWNTENANSLDYSEGFKTFLYVDGDFFDVDYSLEEDVFADEYRNTLIKSIINRIYILKTNEINTILSDKIVLLSGLDSFYVNDLKSIRDGSPELNQVANLVELEMKFLTDEPDGINTHDFTDSTTTEEIMTETEEVTGTGTITAPTGYLIHWIQIERLTGADTVKVGKSLDANDLIYNQELDETDTSTQSIPHLPAEQVSVIYYDVGTLTANLTIQYLKL